MNIKTVFWASALFLIQFTFVSCKKDDGKQDDEKEVDEIFINPVFDGDFPDPTVWRGDDGAFYALCTQVKRTLKSNDLVSWYACSKHVINDKDRSEITVRYKNIYAPQVCEVGGVRLLYVALHNSVADSAVGVFKENKDTGMFEYHGVITSSQDVGGIPDSIDPDVVTDESGRVWLFYGSTLGIHRLELNPDGLSVKDGASPVRIAGRDGYSGSTRDDVFEGAYLYRRNGFWYLFASAGSYNTYHYRIVVGRSTTIDGTFLTKDGKKMLDGYGTTVLSSPVNETLNGPGHNGEIIKDTKGRTYIFYHCHTSKTAGSSYLSRSMMLQQIFWDQDGWPYVEGGTPQRYVTMPYLK